MGRRHSTKSRARIRKEQGPHTSVDDVACSCGKSFGCGQSLAQHQRAMAKRKAGPRRGDKIGVRLKQFWLDVSLGANRAELLSTYAQIKYSGNPRTPIQVRTNFGRMPPRCPATTFCFVCGHDPDHRHHIVQIQHGGTNGAANLVWLCRPCHERIHPWMVKPLVPLEYEQYRPPWWPASTAFQHPEK